MLKVTAPGKVLWIGSYSVLYGGTSHVIAINRRVKAIGQKNDSIVEIVSNFGKYKFNPSELDHVGNSVIRETVKACFEVVGDKFGFSAKLLNHEDFQVNGRKTGIGSSSASTVALASLIVLLAKGELDLETIHKCSQISNYRRQGGVGSGFDIACSVYGTIEYERFRRESIEKGIIDSKITPLPLPKGVEIILGITNRSSDTVNLVSKFEQHKEEKRFLDAISEIDNHNRKAINYLKKGEVEDAIVEVEEGRKTLKSLSKSIGVLLESEEEERIIKEAKSLGALTSLVMELAAIQYWH
jgi:Phosphomevalonate kinase